MGYMHSEIAELVGCSIGNSKSQVHKARKSLLGLLCGDAERVASEKFSRKIGHNLAQLESVKAKST